MNATLSSRSHYPYINEDVPPTVRHILVLLLVLQESAFLSASCPHHCLDVARYAFTSDAANLLETNANLT